MSCRPALGQGVDSPRGVCQIQQGDGVRLGQGRGGGHHAYRDLGVPPPQPRQSASTEVEARGGTFPGSQLSRSSVDPCAPGKSAVKARGGPWEGRKKVCAGRAGGGSRARALKKWQPEEDQSWLRNRATKRPEQKGIEKKSPILYASK